MSGLGDHLLERHRAALPCSMAGSGSRSVPADPSREALPASLRAWPAPVRGAGRTIPGAARPGRSPDVRRSSASAARSRGPGTRSPCRCRCRSGDSGGRAQSARSGRGHRRSRGVPGCPSPPAAAPCGRPWRSRCAHRARGAAVKFLHVGMIGGLGQDPGDDTTLPGHLEASFDAQALDARFHRIPCDQPSPARSPGASPR